MLEFEKIGDYEDVIYEKSGYVVRITLNKPDTLNSGVKDFGKAFAAASAEDDVKVIIIKGAGRALAAGAPLNEVGFVYGWKEPRHGESSPRPSLRSRLKFDRATFFEHAQNILLCPKLTIVQAHGFLLGASMDMFLQCDFIVATEDCKLGEIEVRLGAPNFTISPIMILRCGLTHALDLCLTGRMIDGKEAERIGLINRAVPADQLEAEVNRYAEGFSRFPRDGIAMGKAAKHSVFDIMGITQGLTHSYIMHTFGTNTKFEADEFNFFKERRDMGVKEAIHARNKYYEMLDK
jgi:enoyl-CoA hydratase